jgi:tRNA guanosine-2'-O-methyltransferase
MEFVQFSILLGCAERSNAYAILSLFFSTLKLEHQNTVLGANEVQGFDVRNVSKFWDDDAVDR